MVKLQFDERQFKITLPKQIVMAKYWKKGDKLVVEIDERGDIVLRKATAN
jgi:bifunctional DNA-binding transcriptional regulator/antitoxin component of YhaV-PrlF toxin-antitoxin module